MSREKFTQKWEALRDEWTRRDAAMPAGPVIAELLSDLEVAEREEGEELLNLTQAAHRCGYSADSIGKMVKAGRLTDYGRSNAPRVRACDLPRKPLRKVIAPLHLAHTSRPTARVSTTTPRGGS